MGRRQQNRGPQAFEAFYAELYGNRWTGLRAALLDEGRSQGFAEGLTATYHLDPASVAAAHALQAGPDHEVVDLCAAPGGKTLVIASDMRLGSGASGRLVCNERSASRRARLHRVLQGHLTPAALEQVAVTGHDAARWALFQPEAFDRVLADVPCSSEQHVLRSAAALREWSSSRTRRLAQGAYAIACAAYDALRPGGRMVYSTCALSSAENDEVVGRILDRAGDDGTPCSTQEPSPMPGAERTGFGWLLLPDAARGAGPIYFSAIQKAE